ncbi:hypothetical protein [Salidesulfovibrio onnuriiensis]|uniref:hypothetical protein n=1 Tax=Salidesulfovibrio onnuriiensis TaxID=2583823 RepID=UPI0011C940D2|nr:hypothetical protein [Salidesulfovibrio onnuriiensis]
MKKHLICLLFMALFALGGCASSLMSEIPDGRQAYSVEQGKAVIVFMRPSSFGGAVQSPVFRLTDDSQEFLGIVSSKTMLAYEAAPGKHVFMVTGETANFVEADVIADKIYYVEVEPHFGMFKARFTLEPLTAAQLKDEDFKKDYAKCHFVENTPQSYQWAQDNLNSINSKRMDDYQDWKNEPAEEKKALTPEDGVDF